MAGFREFVTGEVLTAANVDDFLMKQAVMKFADAGARDTALGTAVAGGNALREGMIAYLDDTDDVLKYDGAAWTTVGAAPPAGIGSNVVQTVKTDGFTTTSTSRVTVTGTTVTITPSSDTSKILIVATGISSNIAAGSFPRIYLVRGGTEIANSTGATFNQTTTVFQGTENLASSFAIHFLDSPATIAATTYEIGLSTTTAGTARIGISDGTPTRGAQTVITAIEVAP